MSRARFRTMLDLGMSASITLDAQIEVEIEYSVLAGTAPTRVEPGWPAEVTVHGLWTYGAPVHHDLTWLGTTWIEEDAEMVGALIADWADHLAALADDAADAARAERLEA